MPGNRHMNWGPTVWTPTGTSPVPQTIDGVQGIDIDYRSNIVTHLGDFDIFATMKALANMDPMLTVTCRDLLSLHGLPPGLHGSLFESTHREAKALAAAGGGAYSVQMTNPIIEGNTSGGNYAALGEGRLMIAGESVDGITNPLGFVLT